MSRAALISKHGPLLAAALATGSKADVTGALEDMSTDAYQDGNDDDTADVPAGILATCAVIAGHLLDTLSQPDTNADDLAASVTADQCSFGIVAGQLDTDQPHTVSVDDDPCEVCSGHDGDDADPGNAPPWHPGCGCTIQPTTENRSRRRTPKMTNPRSNSIGIERRQYATGLEVRKGAPGSNTRELVGEFIVHGAHYDVYDFAGEYDEVVERGALRNALARPDLDVKGLYNHDGMVLSRSKNDTLSIRETDTGYACKMLLNLKQPSALDLATAVEDGLVDQMSWAFLDGSPTWSADYMHRTIRNVAEIHDVSAVNRPASPTTSIAVAESLRSAMQGIDIPTARLFAISQELRSGKTISKATAQTLSTVLDHLTNASNGITGLKHPTGSWAPTAGGSTDGTTQGNYPGGNGPGAFGVSNGDGSGSRAVTLDDLELDAVLINRKPKVTLSDLKNDLRR